MKALLRLLLATLVAMTAVNAHAQRSFEPAELEALLAPIALYPDPLLTHILNASQYPQDVAAAASWSRANPQLSGDAALATVQGTTWHPSVKALIAYPDVLARMDESPQWLRDLGEAYATYGPNLMATVQDLRARAQASGYLQSNDQQYVYPQGSAIVVQPVYPNLVYAPYYDPFVVFGGWYWTAYRPVYWRPWVPHPYFVTRVVVAPPVHYRHPTARYPAPRVVHGGPTIRPPFVQSNGRPWVHSNGQPFVRSSGQPFVRSAPAPFRAEAHPPARGHSFAGSTGPLMRGAPSTHGGHGGNAFARR
jgi:hypothetical protein